MVDGLIGITMLLRRIDDLVPGGGSLDLHPRLTLVRAAGPEPRRRLEAVVRLLVDGSSSGGPDPSLPAATIELSGVQLALDAATLERLDIDRRIDPVLVLGDARGATPTAAGSPPPYTPAAPQRVGGGAIDELRSELRTVGARRSELGDRMEATRARLDSFSTAALEVCVGQIEALESRRVRVRGAVEQRQQELAERRRTLHESADRLRSDLAGTDRLDANRIPAARASLVAAVEAPVPPEPTTVALADQLDEALHRFRRVQADRSAAELRLGEARQRLEGASAELDSVRAIRHSSGDPETIRRLEDVREEIFAVGDRSGRRAPGRAKRRLQELRAEEAVLLDRLGFDTYSSYVMGISSVRVDVERSNRVVRAEGEVERIRVELEELRRDAPDDAELDRVGVELEGLVLVATRELDPTGSLPELGELTPDARTELVYGLIEALRNRRVSPTGVEDPAVRAAADALHSALVEATPRAADAGAAAPAPPPPSAPVDDLLAAADAWSSWQRGIATWRDEATSQLGVIEAELAGLDTEDRSAGDPVAEWAELEAALDAALDRLAAAQERVRDHESATAEVAELREDELELRAHERTLLAAIAAAQAPQSAPQAPRTQQAPPGEGSAGAATGAPSAERSDDAQWELLVRLARQRRVSFVGALPMLVIGLGPARSRPEVQARLARMSDLVQVVVLSDDDDDATWVHGLGAAASVVELARRN